MKKIMTKQETQKSVITSREDVASFVQIPPQSDHPNANFKVFAEKGEEILEITIPQDSNGYGFTLKGSRPTRVGRVRRGGAAERAGLRASDILLVVQRNQAHQYTSSAVARIVRNSEYGLMLTVRRSENTIATKNACGSPIKKTKPQSTNLIQVEKLTCSFPRKPLSPIKEQLYEVCDYRHTDFSNSGYTSSGYRSFHDNTSLATSGSQESIFSSDINIATESEFDTPEISTSGIDCLLDIEDDFIVAMRRGLQTFCKPLKRDVFIIDRQQHAIIFQNIEKLVAISEFHLIELSKCCELKGDMLTPHHIAHVYTLRMNETSRLYRKYESGLRVALRALRKVKSDPIFSEFLLLAASKTDLSSDVSSIERLLCRPILHIRKVRDFIDSFSSNSLNPTAFRDIFHCLSLTNISKSTSNDDTWNCVAPDGDIPESVSVVQRIAGNLEFPPKIEPFLLDDGYRSLLYVGECMWYVTSTSSYLAAVPAISGTPYSAVCVLLFGDMLLVVSQLGSRGGMLVRHAPLLVNDVVDTDFTRGSSFSLTTIDNDLDVNGYLDTCYTTPVKCRHHFVPISSLDNNRWVHLISRILEVKLA